MTQNALVLSAWSPIEPVLPFFGIKVRTPACAPRASTKNPAVVRDHSPRTVVGSTGPCDQCLPNKQTWGHKKVRGLAQAGTAFPNLLFGAGSSHTWHTCDFCHLFEVRKSANQKGSSNRAEAASNCTGFSVSAQGAHVSALFVYVCVLAVCSPTSVMWSDRGGRQRD